VEALAWANRKTDSTTERKSSEIKKATGFLEQEVKQTKQ